LADLNIIAISIQDTDKFREAVIQAGANVFVSKFRVIHDLVPAIQGVCVFLAGACWPGYPAGAWRSDL
jgi:hypothetical protein